MKLTPASRPYLPQGHFLSCFSIITFASHPNYHYYDSAALITQTYEEIQV
ncbi:hypothetical protein SAMN04487996_116113 [Dyadobacter soli]|uniref:Uncharacterized protein n=1 Tax=Dyadobacter soli TaxID=659014 RepID=A0A1G7SIA3_9BACT|nr:hypothetical protein SAMN04487996_116113 [Dyadobacter soli]